MQPGEAKALQITRASPQTSNDPHEFALWGRSGHGRRAVPFRVPVRCGQCGGYFALCTEAGSPQQAREEQEGDVRPHRWPEASPGRTEPIS